MVIHTTVCAYAYICVIYILFFKFNYQPNKKGSCNMIETRALVLDNIYYLNFKYIFQLFNCVSIIIILLDLTGKHKLKLK